MSTTQIGVGVDHTGSWTPDQYAIDAGWDYTCIEATAAKGVSSADADGLTSDQCAWLLGYCEATVAERGENARKAQEAAEHIGSNWTGGQCVYFDASTRKHYLCDDESEMVDLYDLIHSADSDEATEEDQAVANDAYSHWCAGTSHAEVEAE